MTTNSPKTCLVCAIIVTYHPDLATLKCLLSNLSNQVDMTLIVDNNSPENYVAWIKEHQQENLTFLPLTENVGVAEGHNHGIRWAQTQKYSHVILFDQDSTPFPDMLERLLTAEEQLLNRGKQVAAVGPQYHDLRHAEPAPFIRFTGLKSNRLYCSNGSNELYETDFLITSGMLIRLSVFNAIGLMDTHLFIDYVDVEWCLRARSLHYQCFGICSAKMNHTLGDRVVSLSQKKRIIPVHSPLRNYYLIRNAILLYKRKYVPVAWSFTDAYRLVLKFGVFSLLIPPRLLNFRMMMIGLWHGLCGIAGKYPSKTKRAESSKN